ncbi:MAG: IS481 family transposase [Leptospirillia bacterium]
MNIHQNARTTPHSRALIVFRVLDERRPPREVAADFGISVRTVYKWLRRFQGEGEAGLLDRTSAAHFVHHRIGAGWVALIGHLRRTCRMTARAIAERLRLCRSTVSGVLARLGLSRLKCLDPPEPVRRYERQHPGDLLHLDIKKLGRFWRAGHRVTGCRRNASEGAGWEFVHVCIDDHSRLAYVEVLENEKGDSAAGFLKRAMAWFTAQGVTVRQVMTDNGACYVSKVFAAVRVRLGLKHIRTRPYTPKTNGKAERFIQTLLREWAYARPYKNSAARAEQLPRWVDHYNHARPHGSLDHLPPISRIRIQTCEQRS